MDLLRGYWDGELDPAISDALEAHLSDCQECTAFVNTYRGTVRTVGQLSEEEIPSALKERLLTFRRRQIQR